MVVERFNGIIFLGDDVARANYLAFNMILREDLAYGGLKGSDDLSDQDRESCKCDNQFLDECAAFGVTSSRSLKQLDGSGQAGNTYYCDRKRDKGPQSKTQLRVSRDPTRVYTSYYCPSLSSIHTRIQSSHLSEAESLATQSRRIFLWSCILLRCRNGYFSP